MNAIGKILLYVGVVVFGGALLAPPLFWLGQWAVSSELIPALRPFGFEKYFNRSLLIIALAFLWPFLRGLGLRDLDALQLRPNPRRWLDLGLGLLIACGGFGFVAWVLMQMGSLVLHRSPSVVDVMSAALTAALVAVIEEGFFRGALFGALRRGLPWAAALLFLSVFFAVLHFIKPDPTHARVTDVAWLSGVQLLPHVFWQFGQPDLVLGTWVTLLIMGWTLGYTVVRTRSLYCAVGMHAGWVFGLKVLGSCTRRQGDPSVWVGADLRSGLVPAVLMLSTLALVAFLLRERGVSQPA